MTSAFRIEAHMPVSISPLVWCGISHRSVLRLRGADLGAKAEFDDTARKLVGMFQKNFAKYEKDVDAEVRAAAPEVRLAAE